MGNKYIPMISAFYIVPILLIFNACYQSSEKYYDANYERDLIIDDFLDFPDAADLIDMFDVPDMDIFEEDTDILLDTPLDDGLTTTDTYPPYMIPVPGEWGSCTDLPPEGDTVSVYLVLSDFQEPFPIEGAMVDVFLNNIITDTPSIELGPTNSIGQTDEFAAPANSVFAYRVNASSDVSFPPGVIKTTIEYDVIVPESIEAIDIILISKSTAIVIPSVFGFRVTSGLGILFGYFKDCGGENVSGIVARLYPPTAIVPCNDEESMLCIDRYFVIDTPDRSQLWTSDDGMYAVFEIPPDMGYILQMHGKVMGSSCSDELEVLGESTNVQIIPDAISFVHANPAVAIEHRCAW